LERENKMSLTKETNIDKIEIVENGIVQVRQATKIIEDGNELSKSYHRWMILPGQDYSDQPDNVKAICAVAHTPAVIEAYEDFVTAQLARNN
jgi:hypothetical protein